MKTTLSSRCCAGLIAATVFSLCAAQSTRADGSTNEVAVAPSNMVADVMAEGPTNALKAITIRDCITRALQNNFDIKIQRMNPSIDSWGVVFQQGVYDPKLSGSVNYTDNTTPNQVGPSTETVTLSPELDVSGKFVSGATYDLNASPTRSNGLFTTNTAGFYAGSTTFAVTQPLLKNFGFDVNTAYIRIARKQRDIDVQKFINQMIASISSVYNAYYELVFAIEDHKAKSEDLQLAQQLLDENRKKLQIGTMSPLDVVQAESGVASREQAIILAARTIKDNENALKLLISQNVAEFQGESFLPVDYPVVEMVETDIASSTRAALESRPDYVAARHAVDKQNIQVKFNRNQLWPEVDLQASYGWNGLGGNLGSWASDVNTRDNPVWSAGVIVTFPLGNRQARANYHSARLQAAQLLLQLKQLEQQIVIAVDNAVGHVRTNLKSVEAAVAATRLADESYKAEKTKLLVGTSTTFLVLQAESLLSAARSAEIRARADYAESLVALAQQEGTTLQKNNIVLDERF
jgi:outer membrane protein TolC